MIEKYYRKKRKILVTTQSIINLLGVVYAHTKMSDDGDLYFTEHGLMYSELLNVENWYEKEWFLNNRERLTGTSSVFRVPTKKINGQSLQLVVKNNRVGEDVPLDTHTLYEFINAEFNSPWEEFSLVMEMRDNDFGPKKVQIKTQQPLAIYVPPERLQLWQTGRSRSKINKITSRHPGINLDILRQYKMVYQWIEGLNIIEAFREIGITGDELDERLKPIMIKVINDLKVKGFIVTDMKPSHVIIGEEQVKQMRDLGKGISGNGSKKQGKYLNSIVRDGQYSVVDYELLIRTPKHDEKVKNLRRHTYLDDQCDRFHVSQLPPFLSHNEIFGVPYVHGHVESTGGSLWVVGCNPRLFDYFLPERWRTTPCHSFSENHEVFYTVTKDNVHIVWKTSRVGERPLSGDDGINFKLKKEYGFNSPFEEFAIAHFLTNNGVPTVYVRAIYMTGSAKIEPVKDSRHYTSHREILGIDSQPILRKDRDYITIRGYYNGSDSWVASHDGQFCKPFNLEKAISEKILKSDESMSLLDITRSRLKNLGYDGTLLELKDILITIDQEGNIIKDSEKLPEARISNFELIHKI
ncbi:MAG: hypothetical protein JXB48_02510 [Candidatus Latescibacteria bacterium]|nr:hypothetical protein [Candidatus Latescibacterota bacterium]